MRRRNLGYYEDVHQPLGPPPGATTERLHTSDRTGRVNQITCEDAGGVFTEYCPSMAQVGVVGPFPTAPGVPAFQPPCVSYCEMPSGKQASTQEDPYNQWKPVTPGMMGFSGPLQTLRARARGGVNMRSNPYYKRTGMISHRHPFHGVRACVGGCGGYGADATGEAAKMYSSASPTTDAVDVYDLYVGQFDKRYVGVQGFGEDSLVDTVGGPALRGLIFGFATYGMASAVGVDSAKAKRLGFVMGAMDIALSIVSNYLKKQIVTTTP